MNFNNFFALAKASGIAEAQIQISRSKTTSIELFRHEIESYSVNDSRSVIACGIYNGKFGSASTEKLDKDTFAYLIQQIIVSASHSEKEDAQPLFKGSPKYHKKNVWNTELAEIPVEKKLQDLFALENAIYACDKRVSEVEAGFTERESSSEFYNSNGLKLKQKRNYFYVSAYAVANQDGVSKTNSDIILDSDYSKLDIQELAKKIVDGAVSKFGGDSITSKKYPTVLRYDVASNFIDALLSSAIAEEVQKHSSLFEGKLGQKILSSKMTIEERPLEKNVFFSYFDDEGVATYNKPIFKNGVLKTYFYNRETASKDGVESTGNAVWEGAKIGTGYSNIFVKPGKQSFEELIAPIEDGVYITDIMGLGTGLNTRSGDFSCQAEGYRIVNGKIAEPLSLITLSGNLVKMWNDIKGFSKDAKLTLGSVCVADAYIKAMNIGGK